MDVVGVSEGDADDGTRWTGDTTSCTRDVPNVDARAVGAYMGAMGVGLEATVAGREEGWCSSKAGIAGRARSRGRMAGVEAAEDTPLVGSFSLLAAGVGEVSIEAGFWTIMLVGRLRGEVGKCVLAALGCKGTCRKVEIFLCEEIVLPGETSERVEGPAMGIDWAIAFPFAFGELA